MTHPETIELFNTVCGAKRDLFFLKKVPNPRHDGWQYSAEYQLYESFERYEVGICDMVRGQLLFPATNGSLGAHGLSHSALILIGTWLAENQIPIEDL